MEGLRTIPTFEDLQEAYEKMLPRAAASEVPAKDLALFSQWSRFDPRLAEIWVSYVAKHWHQINSVSLNKALTKLPWPGAAAVLVEFVKKAIPKTLLGQFDLWKNAITHGASKAHWEQFFVGQRKIAGKAMVADARYSSNEYKKWGYLGREELFRPVRRESVKRFPC